MDVLHGCYSREQLFRDALLARRFPGLVKRKHLQIAEQPSLGGAFNCQISHHLKKCKLGFYEYRFETVACRQQLGKAKHVARVSRFYIKVLFGSVRSTTIAYALQQTISSN
jgi:hypothetical protein